MNFYSEEMLQKKAIRYMEKKYGDEGAFSVKKAYVEGETYNVYMNVEGHEGWEPLVCWIYTTKKFVDNYMSWVFQEQVEEAFSPIFEEIYGDCKLFNLPYGFQGSDIYNYDTKLEDYLTTVNSSTFDMFTSADPDRREEDIQKFRESARAKGWDVLVTVMYVSENELLEINRDNFKKYLNNENYIWRSSTGVSKGSEDFIDWWVEGNK